MKRILLLITLLLLSGCAVTQKAGVEFKPEKVESKMQKEFDTISPPANGKKVSVADTSACPRYCGRLIKGVNAKAKTPDWMVRRLERSGLHSISAIVDITNYVLLELGQPMHAFDANKLNGDIQVRWANQAEAITLLNQQTVKLDKDMLVIADNSGAIAMAGVMGGQSTAVSDETSDIFLESAFFTPEIGRAHV